MTRSRIIEAALYLLLALFLLLCWLLYDTIGRCQLMCEQRAQEAFADSIAAQAEGLKEQVETTPEISVEATTTSSAEPTPLFEETDEQSQQSIGMALSQVATEDTQKAAIATERQTSTTSNNVLKDIETKADTPTTTFAPTKPDITMPADGIGILRIDRIDLRMPVAKGVSKKLLKIAACWLPQTASIGETGNAVIAGHRQYTYGSQFNRLDELEIGDIIGYEGIDGKRLRFAVFEILTLEPGDQQAFSQPTNKSIVTLYTCTPVRIASHRLAVRAVRIG